MTQNENGTWFNRPLIEAFPALTGEMLLFGITIGIVAISRLFNLGGRVLSLDENLNVFSSWLFYQGQGYQYFPGTHGPLQIHLIALIFSLLGDSDFTARLPQAIASILTVVIVWKWRRYLGQAGTLVAAVFMLISPVMMYYGRYARDEAFVGLVALVSFYAILRYLETGKSRYLFLLTAATALNFTAKETAFIYSALILLFLAIYLISRIAKSPWKNPSSYNGFLIALAIGVILLFAAGGAALSASSRSASNSSQTIGTLIGISLIGFLTAVIFLVIGYGWTNLRSYRSFNLIILLGTLVLPQLSALPLKVFGWDPLDYHFTWPGWNIQAIFSQGLGRVLLFLVPLTILAVVIGLLWNKKLWLLNAALFYGIYILLFSTIFSNWQGVLTGLVGSLGYWMQQQAVQKGNQPWYYYLLIQIPIYEFLPALGFGLAAYIGLRQKSSMPPPTPAPKSKQKTADPPIERLTFYLLLWWSLSSLLVYSIAGEKMPWLTYHITLPMILLSGWGLGQLIEHIDWKKFLTGQAATAIVLVVLFIIGLAGVLASFLGSNPPFQGKSLNQLTSSSTAIFWILVSGGSAAGLVYLKKYWETGVLRRLGTIIFFGLLAFLTARTAFRAAFNNYDSASEFLAYAQNMSGVKEVMQQIDEISTQTAGGHNIVVAYDQGVLYPFNWYLRSYPNAQTFAQPTTDVLNAPTVIVDQNNFNSIKSIVQDKYYQFNYNHLAWPNQDYFALTWPRIWNAISNPSMRAAIFQIWFNRDYTKYAQLTGNTTLTPASWEPSSKMELFVRKDVATQLWEYNIGQTAPQVVDPYKQNTITLTAKLIMNPSGLAQGQLNDPHGIAVAPDGSIFIADTNNNRIVHLKVDGSFIKAFGNVSLSAQTPASPATLNQPWGIAISPDGQWVYVTDTWNHRVAKYTADGTPVTAWGHSAEGTSQDPFGLYGPRGIAVDAKGNVLVVDTGNKRVIIYDGNGQYISQFGSAGLQPGQFDEPVGIALDSQGNVYIADTWNQRVQVFAPSPDGKTYTPLRQWNISGWYGDSLENKPYVAVDNNEHVFVTDPEMYRVLEFTTQGDFIRAWGDFGTDTASFGLASSIAVDQSGNVDVSDAKNNRVAVFTLP